MFEFLLNKYIANYRSYLLYLVICIAPYPFSATLGLEYDLKVRYVIFFQILISVLFFNKLFIRSFSSNTHKIFITFVLIIFSFKIFSSLGSGYLLLFNLLFGYLILFCLDDYPHYRINVDIFIIISFLILVSTYVLFIDNLDELMNIRKQIYGGFASNPMIALYAGLILIFSTCSKRLYAKVISFICILILLHIANRTAILSTIIGLVIILFTIDRPFKTIIPLYSSYLIFISIITKIFSLESVFFQAFYRFKLKGNDHFGVDRFSSGRLESSSNYLDVFIKDLPNCFIFGKPLGTAQALYESDKTLYFAHNVPLYYLVELGIVGLCLFLIMHYIYIKKAIFEFKSNNSLPLAICLFYISASLFLNISSYPLIFIIIFVSFCSKIRHNV